MKNKNIKLKRTRDFSFKLKSISNYSENLKKELKRENFVEYQKYKKRKSNSPDINNDASEIIRKIKIYLFKRKNKELIVIKEKKKNEEEVLEFFELGHLGKGAFGVCYLYESVDEGERCAAKIIEKDSLKGDRSQQNIINEISLQKSFNHPKIVKVKKYAEDDKKIYILLELCKNNTLEHLIKKRGHLTEIETKCYIFQLIQGIKYLHNKNIIHRNLKPSNIFLDEKLELKIGDFGLVGKLNNKKKRRYSFCGTPAFMAPEIIDKRKRGYSLEVDIWSLGIIMYNLLTGQLPFNGNGKEPKKLYDKILYQKLEFPQSPEISNVAQNLLTQILEKNPKKRPGLNQILYHDFFHIGTFPEFLNVSTIDKAPSPEEIRKYMPDADKNGRVNKEEIVNMCLYKLIVNNNIDIKYEDIGTYIIKHEDSIKGQKFEYWVTYIHKSHNGFYYYEMNNNLKGIIFQEDSDDDKYEGVKLMLNEKTQEFYVINHRDYVDDIKKYKVDDCPSSLKGNLDDFLKYCKKFKKMKEQYYKNKNSDIDDDHQIIENEDSNSIIEQNTVSSYNNIRKGNSSSSISESTSSIMTENNEKDNSAEEKELIYISSFSVEKYAIFIVLSDNVKQVKFNDRIDILISEEKEIAQYVDTDNNKTVLSLVNIMKNSNKEFAKRLKYIKKVNQKELKNKINIKSEREKDD